jgi:thymidylate synthase
VIPISQADDLQVAAEVSDVPCTVSIQFLVRNGQLDLITHMRSNDLYFGFPYDVFLFTFWHEMMSLDLGLPLGRYHHFVGSLHIYEDRADELARSIGERDRRPFPSSMPPLDRLDQLREVLRLEKALRSGSIVDPRFSTGLSRCWDELILVLLQGELLRNGNVRGANLVRERLRDTVWFDHLADSTVTKKRRAS